MNNSHKIKH